MIWLITFLTYSDLDSESKISGSCLLWIAKNTRTERGTNIGNKKCFHIRRKSNMRKINLTVSSQEGGGKCDTCLTCRNSNLIIYLARKLIDKRVLCVVMILCYETSLSISQRCGAMEDKETTPTKVHSRLDISPSSKSKICVMCCASVVKANVRREVFGHRPKQLKLV